MIRCPDNQINASFIDISRIKWLVFFIVVVFLPHNVFPRTPRNTGVYTRHPTFVTAMSGVLTRLPAKLSKNGMRVYTLSDRWSKKNCVYIRPPKRRG